ncbi:TraV family lipoprotein [Vibrio cyclitrophicus]|uniref:TraV family lipoprotein n=1 Tax=Vibrio cyclitrophicus TaxID=47951 RepID=UPI0011B71DAD|nr:TraV family lipoprotein [Vibrio cyclitrophicus]
MIKQIILTSFVLLTLAGCSVVGEDEGVCPGAKSGVACASVREVYELTNVYNNAEDYAKATGDERAMVTDEDGEMITGKEYKEKYGTELPKEAGETHSNQPPSYSQAPALSSPEAAYQHLLLPAPEPVAMRKPADIVRTLVRPYTDKETLQIPGYGFIEATQRTWVVDRSAKTNDSQYVNFHVRKESQEQNYGVNDDGQIGVESRNARPAISDSELRESARSNANSLIDQLRQ